MTSEFCHFAAEATDGCKGGSVGAGKVNSKKKKNRQRRIEVKSIAKAHVSSMYVLLTKCWMDAGGQPYSLNKLVNCIFFFCLGSFSYIHFLHLGYRLLAWAFFLAGACCCVPSVASGLLGPWRFTFTAGSETHFNKDMKTENVLNFMSPSSS